MEKPHWKAARVRAIVNMVAAKVAEEIDAQIERELLGSQFFMTRTTFDGNKLRQQHYDWRSVVVTCDA